MSGHTTALRGERGHGAARPEPRGLTPNDAEAGADAPTEGDGRARGRDDGGRHTDGGVSPDA